MNLLNREIGTEGSLFLHWRNHRDRRRNKCGLVDWQMQRKAGSLPFQPRREDQFTCVACTCTSASTCVACSVFLRPSSMDTASWTGHAIHAYAIATVLSHVGEELLALRRSSSSRSGLWCSSTWSRLRCSSSSWSGLWSPSSGSSRS